jgi:hypothetical protein
MSELRSLEEINRFDLEQEIMNCWHVVDDIRSLYKHYLDGPKPMTEDEVSNVLLGLESLYQIKFEQLFQTFEQVIKNGGFNAKPEVQFGSPNGC